MRNLSVADLKIILYIAGASFACVAAGLLLVPAALFLAGVFCLAAVWLLR